MKKALFLFAFFLNIFFLGVGGLSAEIAVFPNPWMPQLSSGHQYGITFANIPTQCSRISIYDINGVLVKQIGEVQSIRKYDSAENLFYVDWNGRASDGHSVASGVYIFIAYDASNNPLYVGKFAVIK